MPINLQALRAFAESRPRKPAIPLAQRRSLALLARACRAVRLDEDPRRLRDGPPFNRWSGDAWLTPAEARTLAGYGADFVRPEDVEWALTARGGERRVRIKRLRPYSEAKRIVRALHLDRDLDLPEDFQ